jgi:phage-related protein
MSVDLSWLWNTIQSLYGAVQNFLNLILTTLQNIVNTGQGIYAGFAAFASAVWDAFIRGLDTLGNWVKQAFEWIYSGLNKLGQWLGENIGVAIGWIFQFSLARSASPASTLRRWLPPFNSLLRDQEVPVVWS